jgi:hypothetical protein
VKTFMLQDDPRWMLQLAAWMCHDREVRQRRAESLAVFDRKTFKYELDTMLDNFVAPINITRHAVGYLVAWETPWLSALAFAGALLVAWHDLLPFTAAMVFLGHAIAVLVYGALPDASKAALQRALGRARGPKGRNLFERLRNFRNSLGMNQVRMNRLNTIVLKVRSLYTWRDPPRTRLYIVALGVLALVWAVVPYRVLFTAFVVVNFTRPLRPSGKGLGRLAFDRFWDGLPLPKRSDAAYLPLEVRPAGEEEAGTDVGAPGWLGSGAVVGAIGGGGMGALPVQVIG